jgi:NAD(P)-dependent dehydrogenase (short-subunit alcohol dehydrogenase family)
MVDMAGTVIVVAGGATGIGAETARQLVAAGAHVLVGDVNQDGGRRTVEAIGDGARFAAFDIADEGSVKALIDTAHRVRPPRWPVLQRGRSPARSAGPGHRHRLDERRGLAPQPGRRPDRLLL